MSAVETCAVCGRTILKGERTRTYLTPDGERRGVCELCHGRAEAAGWVWEELAGDAQRAPRERRRRGSLGVRLRRPRRQEEGGEEAVATERPEEPTPRRSPDPAAPGAGVGRPERRPDTPRSRAERAIDRFNASDHARTVRGLTRTLGKPWVSVGAAARSSGEVRITVAWELTWYQWGVDVREDGGSVHELARGDDPAELDPAARQWNARVDDDGRLVPGAPE